jgi:hypothetical protein
MHLHFHLHHFNQLLFHEVLMAADVNSRAPPCGQHPGPEAPQLHTLHFATANTVEATIDEIFLGALDKMIRPGTDMRPQVVARIFTDLIDRTESETANAKGVEKVSRKFCEQQYECEGAG